MNHHTSAETGKDIGGFLFLFLLFLLFRWLLGRTGRRLHHGIVLHRILPPGNHAQR